MYVCTADASSTERPYVFVRADGRRVPLRPPSKCLPALFGKSDKARAKLVDREWHVAPNHLARVFDRRSNAADWGIGSAHLSQMWSRSRAQKWNPKTHFLPSIERQRIAVLRRRELNLPRDLVEWVASGYCMREPTSAERREVLCRLARWEPSGSTPLRARVAADFFDEDPDDLAVFSSFSSIRTQIDSPHTSPTRPNTATSSLSSCPPSSSSRQSSLSSASSSSADPAQAQPQPRSWLDELFGVPNFYSLSSFTITPIVCIETFARGRPAQLRPTPLGSSTRHDSKESQTNAQSHEENLSTHRFTSIVQPGHDSRNAQAIDGDSYVPSDETGSRQSSDGDSITLKSAPMQRTTTSLYPSSQASSSSPPRAHLRRGLRRKLGHPYDKSRSKWEPHLVALPKRGYRPASTPCCQAKHCTVHQYRQDTVKWDLAHATMVRWPFGLEPHHLNIAQHAQDVRQPFHHRRNKERHSYRIIVGKRAVTPYEPLAQWSYDLSIRGPSPRPVFDLCASAPPSLSSPVGRANEQLRQLLLGADLEKSSSETSSPSLVSEYLPIVPDEEECSSWNHPVERKYSPPGSPKRSREDDESPSSPKRLRLSPPTSPNPRSRTPSPVSPTLSRTRAPKTNGSLLFAPLKTPPMSHQAPSVALNGTIQPPHIEGSNAVAKQSIHMITNEEEQESSNPSRS